MAIDVSVVTSGHDVADARLHRVTEALLAQGLRVEVLGLGAAADAPRGVAARTRPRGSMPSRVLTAVRYAGGARGRVLLALDPDSLLACRAVARVRGRRVVADVHEDYAALLRDRAWARGPAGRVAAMVANAATAAARGSDLVVVADEHVPPVHAPHRMVVRNLPSPTMLPAPGPPDVAPRAVYVGDVRPSRGLWAMLDAVEASPGWRLDLVGPVHGAEQAAVERRLSRIGRDRVRLHGRRPPIQAWQVASGAWCGLALLEDTPAFREALPSKLYEYLSCGLPVVVTDLPRQAELVRSAGAGVVVPVETAGAAAGAVLRSWSQDPRSLAGVRAAALAWRAQNLTGGEYAELARRVAALAGSPTQ